LAGGGTLTASQELCSDDLSHDEVFTIMSALVETNLVRRESAAGSDEPRFAMLEILREFGLEQLTLHGELAAVQRRHAAYMLILAQEAEPALRGPDQSQWLRRFDQEHDNVRAALHWAREHDTELGLRIGTTIWRYWYMRRHAHEGLTWLESFIDKTQDHAETQHLRARATYGASVLASAMGDYGKAEQLAETSFHLYQEMNDVAGMCSILNAQGNYANLRNRYEVAENRYCQALTLSRTIGDKKQIAANLNNLAIIATIQGRYSEAQRFLEESLIVKRELGHHYGIALSLLNLSNALCKQGDYDRATNVAEECLLYARQSDNQWAVAAALDNLGKATTGQRNYQRALAALEESQQIFAEVNDESGLAAVLRHLADLGRERHDWKRAETYYRASIEVAQHAGSDLAIAKCLAGWASILLSQGQGEQAARYAGKAAILYTASGILPQANISRLLEQTKYAIQEALDEITFHVAWEQGKSLSLDDVLTMR
jgi:tetratricopeptide (TPR) repeat protein